MPITVVLGEQRGDEGKGRFVDMLAEEHDVVARFNGGHNAGHTVVLPDERVLKLHIMPSGIAHEDTLNIIGNGCLVHPEALQRDILHVESNYIDVNSANLMLSSAAHLIMPSHVLIDRKRESGRQKQGSTQSGISPSAGDKYMRVGARAEIIENNPDRLVKLVYEGLRRQRTAAGKLLRYQAKADREYAEGYVAIASNLGRFVTDTTFRLNQMLKDNSDLKILAEGAQAFQLDIDHGMYPFTTSSSTTSSGVLSGLGLPPQQLDRIIGVSKAIPSHVGGGPFATEITNKELLRTIHGDMSTVDAERGTTTGRVRRLGNFDIPSIRRAQMINGTTEMAITKLDWVRRYPVTIPVCVRYSRKGKKIDIAPDAAYKIEQVRPMYTLRKNWSENIQDVREFEDLPKIAQDYITFIEDQTEKPITMIGVGPKRDQVILR